MRVLSPRLVAQPKSPVSSAARSRATVRCPLHLPCPAPPRLRHLRAPLPLLQRRHPQSLLGYGFPPRLLSVLKRSCNFHRLSLHLPCWGHRPTPTPTLLTHTRTRSLVFCPDSTTHGQCTTRCRTAASTKSGIFTGAKNYEYKPAKETTRFSCVSAIFTSLSAAHYQKANRNSVPSTVFTFTVSPFVHVHSVVLQTLTLSLCFLPL